MRFILTATGFTPTDGAIIPELIKNGVQGTAEAVTLSWIEKAVMWVGHIGLPVISEALLVWAMFCILMAITGKGAWMERAVKSFIGFVMVGVASYSI